MYFPVGDQDTCRPQQIRHSADSTVGKGNIQRDQPSSGFPCLTSLCPFLIFFQFMIPAFTFIHIHKNRLQQAHSHHKYRILPDQIFRKFQIIVPQFIIITDSRIFPGIRHQQPEDTVCIIVYLVHFQCFGNLALHLIIQTCVIIQTADLFRRAFFMQPLFHRPAHGILTTPDTVFFPHFFKEIAGFHPLCQHMLHMFVSGDHSRQIHRKLFYNRNLHEKVLQLCIPLIIYMTLQIRPDRTHRGFQIPVFHHKDPQGHGIPSSHSPCFFQLFL